jgi:signal transduction histidine kinase/Flp pilus assembly protein TadD
MNRSGVMRILLCCFFSFHFVVAEAQNNPEELDSLIEVLRTSEDISTRAKVHSRVAWLNIIKDIDYAKAHLDTSLALYQQQDDIRAVANVNYRFGVLYRFAGEYEKALNYANRYQAYAESVQDTMGLANIFYQKGVILSQSGDYEGSLQEYFNCLRTYEDLDDTSSRAFTLNSIGIVYKNLNKYKEAEESYLTAISLLEPIDDKNNLADAYHSLGTLYATQDKYQKALDYFNRALAIGIELKHDWGIAKDYSSIGLLHMEEKQYDLAIDYLQKAHKLFEENKYEEDLTESLLNLGQAYMLKGELKRSEQYLIQAEERPSESLRISKDVHFALYELYVSLGLPQKALKHLEHFGSYKDSLYQEENIKSINNLQMQYETEKKNNELHQNRLLLEQKEVQILKSRNLLYLSIAGLILLLIIGLGSWYTLRQRQLVKNKEIEHLKAQKAVTKLESLIEGEEKERKRLAQDLHDGINGDLSVIKYKITEIDVERLSAQEQAGVTEAIEMLDKAIEQVRNISHNLAPPSLQRFSLTEALFQFCQNMGASADVEIKFQSFGNPIKLNSEYETAIYRMVQELINNIVKHAESSEALVQLNHHADTLDITIEDNGKGYDTASYHSGIGLKNVYSRAAFLQSELYIDSSEKGTTATLQIDLRKLKHD